MIDGFASISRNTYDVKEVVHKINSNNGYLTDVYLGANIEELYNKFAEDQAGRDEKNPEDVDLGNVVGSSSGSDPIFNDSGGAASAILDGNFSKAGSEILDAGGELGDGDVGDAIDELF